MEVQFSIIACGWLHSTAFGRLQNGDWLLFGWGSNKHQQIGKATGQNRNKILLPKCITCSTDFPNSYIIDIQSGWSHMLALMNDGAVLSWGRNDYGQCGRNSGKRTAFPIAHIPSLKDIVQISCGSEHSAAVSSTRQVLLWGWNEHGNLGQQQQGNNSGVNNSVCSQIPAKLCFVANDLEFSGNSSEATDDGVYKADRVVCAGAMTFLSTREPA